MRDDVSGGLGGEHVGEPRGLPTAVPIGNFHLPEALGVVHQFRPDRGAGRVPTVQPVAERALPGAGFARPSETPPPAAGDLPVFLLPLPSGEEPGPVGRCGRLVGQGLADFSHGIPPTLRVKSSVIVTIYVDFCQQEILYIRVRFL